jgi:aminoglycoside/choline kinase family phosphotransferase
MNTLLAVAVLALGVLSGFPQDKAPAEDPHHQGVVERGDHVMGFSQDKSTHHFRLYPDGGAIEAESNAAADAATRDEIRSHFAHIVKMFSAGNFSAPMLIHAQNPPGVEAMKKLRGEIQYKVENTEQGARIRITTKNSEALEAVHKFLRFQISDHQTGDSSQVTTAP